MADQIAIRFEDLTANEGSQLPVVVNFRNRVAGTASTPTTAEYKVMDIENEEVITDWTSMGTPDTRMTLQLDKDDLSLDQSRSRVEFSRSADQRRLLIVAADRGLSTQVIEQRQFRVRNVGGFVS